MSEHGTPTPPPHRRRRRLQLVPPGELVARYRRRLRHKRQAWIIRQRGGRILRDGDGVVTDAADNLTAVTTTGRPLPPPDYVVQRWAPAELNWPVLVGLAFIGYGLFSSQPAGLALVTAMLTLIPNAITWALRKFLPFGWGKKVKRVRLATAPGIFVLFLLIIAGAIFGAAWAWLTIPAAGILFFFYELTEWNRDLIVAADRRHMHVYGVMSTGKPAVKYEKVDLTNVSRSWFDKFLGMFGLDVGTLRFDTSSQEDYGIQRFGKVRNPDRHLAILQDIYDGTAAR